MKKTVLTVGAVAIVTFGSTFVAQTENAHAQPSLDDVNKQQKDVKDKLSKAESKIADVLYEIKDINEEIDRLKAALKENKAEIEKNEKKMDKLQVEIDELNEKIEKRSEILKDRISSYQDNGGNISYVDVFLGSKSFNEFISRLSAAVSITNADADLIKDNEADREELEKKLEKQKEVTQELEDQKDTIKVQQEQTKEQKEKLKKKEAKVEKEKSKLEGKSSDLKALESEIRASIQSPSATSASSGNNNAGSGASASNNSTEKSTSGGSSSVPYTGGGGSAIEAGKQFIGSSTYSYGAQNPSAGLFDCSGFVNWAYAQEGVSLPRTASGMASSGQKVSYSDAQPGDLVIFRGGSHVGIYLGNGKFLGSQNSTGVAVADMNSGYWANHFDNNVRRVK